MTKQNIFYNSSVNHKEISAFESIYGCNAGFFLEQRSKYKGDNFRANQDAEKLREIHKRILENKFTNNDKDFCDKVLRLNFDSSFSSPNQLHSSGVHNPGISKTSRTYGSTINI